MKQIEQLRAALAKIGATIDATEYTLNCDAPKGYVWSANLEPNYAIHYATNSESWLTQAIKEELPALKMGLDKVTDPDELAGIQYDLDDDAWKAEEGAPEHISWPRAVKEDLIEAAITHEWEDNEIFHRVTGLMLPYRKSLGKLTKEGKGIKVNLNSSIYSPSVGVNFLATVVVNIGMEEDEALVQLLNNTLKAIANEYSRKTISLMNKEHWSLAILSQ